MKRYVSKTLHYLWIGNYLPIIYGYYLLWLSMGLILSIVAVIMGIIPIIYTLSMGRYLLDAN